MTDCKGVLLPFTPGFCYAAFETRDEAESSTLEMFSAIPDWVFDYPHGLDVSERKVIGFLNQFYHRSISMSRYASVSSLSALIVVQCLLKKRCVSLMIYFQ